jgi:esterase/lipase
MFDRLQTADRQLVLFERGGHVITRDVERKRVADTAAAFVRRVTGWPKRPARTGRRR